MKSALLTKEKWNAERVSTTKSKSSEGWVLAKQSLLRPATGCQTAQKCVCPRRIRNDCLCGELRRSPRPRTGLDCPQFCAGWVPFHLSTAYRNLSRDQLSPHRHSS